MKFNYKEYDRHTEMVLNVYEIYRFQNISSIPLKKTEPKQVKDIDSLISVWRRIINIIQGL